MTLDLAEVRAARDFLRDRVRTTPIEATASLGSGGGKVSLKLEQLQITGSFKVRGAWWRLHRLSAAERARGVVTASAGNHGLGVAWAARELDIHAIVCVPAHADVLKVRAIEELGARVLRSPHDGFDETERWARQEHASRTWVSAFDDPDVMTGNGGTLALELLDQIPDLTRVILPTGGGGLLAGLAFTLHAVHPTVEIVAVQHAEAPALAWSYARGHAVTEVPAYPTAAGGLEGGFGKNTFAVVQGLPVRVEAVTEAELRAAVQWLWDHHRHVCEPSGAAAIAARMRDRRLSAGHTAVLVTGRNVARATLAEWLGG